MKREILFRGKSIQNGKWLYGNIQIPEAPYDEYFMWDNGWQMQVDANTIGQYTGLKDKNNKEIYEGDIVTTNDNRFFTIEYREEEAAFKMIDYGTAPFERDIRELTKKEINEQRIMVIGKIFDTHELLKQQRQ